MRLQEISGNIHAEIIDYLETKGPEDAADMGKYLGAWVASKGYSPKKWSKGTTGLGTTMYVITFMDGDIEKYLAFDDQADIGEITDNEPDPASYS